MAYQYHFYLVRFPHLMKFGTNDRFSSFFHVSTSANIFPVAGFCHRCDMSKIPSRWVTWICLKSYGDFSNNSSISENWGSFWFFENFEIHIQNRPANQLQHIPSAVSMSPPALIHVVWEIPFRWDPTHAPQ